MKRSPLKRKSKNSTATFRRKAVEVFNRWIRERDLIQLKGRCYTCGGIGTDAGHWKHGCNALKFDERAVKLQCPKCNRFLSGNLAEYTLRLIKEYGQDVVDELHKLSHTTKQFSKKDYEEIIDRYS